MDTKSNQEDTGLDPHEELSVEKVGDFGENLLDFEDSENQDFDSPENLNEALRQAADDTIKSGGSMLQEGVEQSGGNADDVALGKEKIAPIQEQIRETAEQGQVAIATLIEGESEESEVQLPENLFEFLGLDVNASVEQIQEAIALGTSDQNERLMRKIEEVLLMKESRDAYVKKIKAQIKQKKKEERERQKNLSPAEREAQEEAKKAVERQERDEEVKRFLGEAVKKMLDYQAREKKFLLRIAEADKSGESTKPLEVGLRHLRRKMKKMAEKYQANRDMLEDEGIFISSLGEIMEDQKEEPVIPESSNLAEASTVEDNASEKREKILKLHTEAKNIILEMPKLTEQSDELAGRLIGLEKDRSEDFDLLIKNFNSLTEKIDKDKNRYEEIRQELKGLGVNMLSLEDAIEFTKQNASLPPNNTENLPQSDVPVAEKPDDSLTTKLPEQNADDSGKPPKNPDAVAAAGQPEDDGKADPNDIGQIIQNEADIASAKQKAEDELHALKDDIASLRSEMDEVSKKEAEDALADQLEKDLSEQSAQPEIAVGGAVSEPVQPEVPEPVDSDSYDVSEPISTSAIEPTVYDAPAAEQTADAQEQTSAPENTQGKKEKKKTAKKAASPKKAEAKETSGSLLDQLRKAREKYNKLAGEANQIEADYNKARTKKKKEELAKVLAEKDKEVKGAKEELKVVEEKLRNDKEEAAMMNQLINEAKQNEEKVKQEQEEQLKKLKKNVEKVKEEAEEAYDVFRNETDPQKRKKKYDVWKEKEVELNTAEDFVVMFQKDATSKKKEVQEKVVYFEKLKNEIEWAKWGSENLNNFTANASKWSLIGGVGIIGYTAKRLWRGIKMVGKLAWDIGEMIGNGDWEKEGSTDQFLKKEKEYRKILVGEDEEKDKR